MASLVCLQIKKMQSNHIRQFLGQVRGHKTQATVAIYQSLKYIKKSLFYGQQF